jgi:hypothetical protein
VQCKLSSNTLFTLETSLGLKQSTRDLSAAISGVRVFVSRMRPVRHSSLSARSFMRPHNQVGPQKDQELIPIEKHSRF